MPTVPRIQRQVQPTAFPSARRRATLTPLAAGVGLAQAQGNKGEALYSAGTTIGIATARLEAARQEAAEKARNEANKAAAMRLKNRADEFIRKAMYAPGTGYMFQKGENALFLPEKAQHDMREFIQTVDPEVSNPEQRLAWEEIAANMQDEVMLSVYRHTGTEQFNVITSEYTRGLANAQALAGAAAMDPPTMLKHMADGFGTIEAQGKHLGWGRTEIDDAKFVFGSNVNTTAIHNLLAAGQTQKARDMFNAAKAQKALTGEQQAQLQTAVDAGTVKDKAYATFDKLDKSGMTPADQRKAAQQIPDSKERELVEGMIEHEVTADAGMERQAIEARALRLTQILLKNPSLSAIPANDLSLMKGGELQDYMSLISNIRESTAQGAPSPHPKESKPSVMAYLIDLAQKDKKLFAQVPLENANFVGSLAKGDYEQALRARAAAREGNEKAFTEAMAGEFSFNDAWVAALASVGKKKSDKDTSDIMDKVRADGRLEMLDPKRQGRPLTVPEWETIMKRNLIEFTLVDRYGFGMFDTTMQGYQIKYENIPVAMRIPIRDAINKRDPGNTVKDMATDPRMVATYRGYLLDQRLQQQK